MRRWGEYAAKTVHPVACRQLPAAYVLSVVAGVTEVFQVGMSQRDRRVMYALWCQPALVMHDFSGDFVTAFTQTAINPDSSSDISRAAILPRLRMIERNCPKLH